jgi:hypothetical protein
MKLIKYILFLAHYRIKMNRKDKMAATMPWLKKIINF